MLGVAYSVLRLGFSRLLGGLRVVGVIQILLVSHVI
jgi:hypothetical protein